MSQYGMVKSPDTALVVVNLGTPDAPSAAAVKSYLAEFLSDRRIVALSPLLWKPILHGVILPLRAPRSARNYRKIWLPEGSPLAVHTKNLADALQLRLPQWRVMPAMRYGRPALGRVLQQLHEESIRRAIVLPLYPQYSTTTTASVMDVVQQYASVLKIDLVEDYSSDAAWVAAVADSVRHYRSEQGAGEHLLFSFHGLPQKIADAGDPYPQRCEVSARLIAGNLGLHADDWSLSYQSRFGKQRWLEPSTQRMLTDLAEQGVRTVDVVCPGFAVDCLETLEEIAIGLAECFAEHGGRLRYVPCLNAASPHVDALTKLVLRTVGE
jgi:ferrochelatase